jgi:hypothetical protein
MGDIQPPSPPQLEASPLDSCPTPSSSFREVIMAAAERLERPAVKRRKPVAGKPHTGMRKVHEHNLTAAAAYEKARIDKIGLSEVEPHGRMEKGERRAKIEEGGLWTDLSRKTMSRLDAFRLKPSPKTAIREQNNGPTTHSGSSEGGGASHGANVGGDTSDLGPGLSKAKRSVSSEEALEATLLLDHDDFNHSSTLHMDCLADDETAYASPFDSEDFDQGSLDDMFLAVESGFIDEASDNANNKPLFPTHDIAHISDCSDSDFGSDPFEPDDPAPEYEEIQSLSFGVHSFNPPTRQGTKIDTPKRQSDFVIVLPPCYQVPRTSPPTFKTSITPVSRRPQKAIPPAAALEPQQKPLPPFLRPSFPKSVPPHSPISNLTPSTRILTCFRTAEYLRAISPSLTAPLAPGLLIELYALVTSSTRPGNGIQTFTFADLFFPARPPHLHGSWFGWEGSELFEDDTKVFLGATKDNGKMCRAIVRPKRDIKGGRRGARAAGQGTGSSPLAKKFGAEGGSPGRVGENGQVGHGPFGAAAAEVEVLNIWEATWEDIEYVKGIVCA